jgi:hypothetical protein
MRPVAIYIHSVKLIYFYIAANFKGTSNYQKLYVEAIVNYFEQKDSRFSWQ